MEANPGEDWAPEQPRQRRARRAHRDFTCWEYCFNNKRGKPRWEKVDAGYYPRQVGERGTLSKNDRRKQRSRKGVGTWLRREGSGKTIPDVEAMETQISDLQSQLNQAAQISVAKVDNLDQLDKEKEKIQQADYQAKQRIHQIGGMRGREGV